MGRRCYIRQAEAFCVVQMNAPINRRQWNGAEPPDYAAVYRWRMEQIQAIRDDAKICRSMGREPYLLAGALEYYRTRPAEFISQWCDTFDPRNAADPDKLTTMPMVLFPRQVELVEYLYGLVLNQANGLIEKCRDMGATFVACGFSVWLWRFMPGSAIGWGSRTATMVDELGDPKSIFEKLRQIIRGLPREFRPVGFDADRHALRKRIINPENGSTIVGEVGDDIGRGGRTLIYFKDESAHYEHPELIEASLGNNTNVQVDISSVNGLGNVFHRKRMAGVVWSPKTIDMVKNRYNVFIMDWAENPLHTQEWFDNQKEDRESAGLGHVFAQEVLRDYAGAVTGVIIPPRFVEACIDAHLVIPGMEDGKWVGAYDPADEGGDQHAAGARKGVVLKYSDMWGEGDPAEGVHKLLPIFRALGPMEIEYDSIGVGTAVKTETNRLAALPEDDPDRMPRFLKWVAWNAGAGVLNPDEPIHPVKPNEDVTKVATNKEQYANIKAQAWWAMRTRAEKTTKAVAAVKAGLPCPYDVMELCSIDSASIEPHVLAQLKMELSQAVRKKDIVSTKLTVDKKPPGTKSPNLADKTVMLFFPMPIDGYDWGAML